VEEVTLIQAPVMRGITLGVAAVAAATSTALAQLGAVARPVSSTPAPAPLLASDQLAVASRLNVEQGRGALAVEQARQLADLQPAGVQEAGARLPSQARPGALASRPAPVPAPAQPAAAASSAAPASPPGSVQDIIVNAFTPYGAQAVQWGLRVARCESGYNPRAVNPAGPYYGLFQFAMPTFKGTPYGGQDILDPVANASAAAWKYGISGGGAWGCK
jgi:Transglycosylase SLT domain